MCGITGKLLKDTQGVVLRSEIEAMLEPIFHRGPDGTGVHLDGNVGLGHRRLSIIDVAAGSQPMSNEDDTIWIVFNGEIYNFQELRQELLSKGHVFRTHCDTEVIIHLYEELGTGCVTRLRGMFAFAIWDSRRRRLLVARDRVGIKPLYFCDDSKAFYFASELKAIIADPDVSRDIDLSALRQFFSFYYLPGAATPFKSIRKLLPGHFMVLEDGVATTRRYWDLQFTDTRAGRPFGAAVEELHALLESTVRDHMIADVPVGVLLSGGVDSSAVLSLAVNSTGKSVQTFTVGFTGDGVVDERPYARLAASRFGSEHHEATITPEDFWGAIPGYVWHMEEPVCEPPAIALHHISTLASRHVKVLLSGEGGDEAFAGYPNYPNLLAVNKLERMLGPLASSAGAIASGLGALIGNGRLIRYGGVMGRPLASHYFSRTSTPAAFFNRNAEGFFTSEFMGETDHVSAAATMASLLQPVANEGLLNRMLYADSKSWLPDDLLVKADKMTMATSVELRVPLLDHRVLEFAASLPDEHKVAGRQTKRALKAAFAKIVPPAILNRKKVGFPVPYESWLKGRFAPKIRELFATSELVERGLVEQSQLQRRLDGALPSLAAKDTFSLLVAEHWLRQFAGRPVSAAR